MSIKRFIANKDNTITNAFKSNLNDRGTEANMGKSDVLETFSIFAQASTSSIEKSRILIDFPVSEISSSRTLGTANLKGIPESGSVRFFLRMFNAEHSQTVPESFTLNVVPISASWQEGFGLDMESYLNKGASNWITSSADPEPQKIRVKFVNALTSSYDNGFVTVYDGAKSQFNFYFNDGNDSAPGAGGTDVSVTTTGLTTVNAIVLAFNNTVNARSEFTSTYSTASASNRFVDITNAVAGPSTAPSASADLKNLSPDQILITTTKEGSNDTMWVNQGGDYRNIAYTPGSTVPLYSYSMETGLEDVELDITALVEEWLANLDGSGNAIGEARRNYGLGIFMSGTFEDGSLERSYYTKKFFARSSEFFFKRPLIEARWNGSVLDDRSRLKTANSQITNADNTFNVYYYNWINGQLKDFPNSAVPNFTLTTDKTLGNKVTLATDTTNTRLDTTLGKKLSPPGSNIDVTSPNIADATLTINDGTNSRAVTFKNGAAGNASQVQMDSSPTVATALTRLAAAINDTSVGTAVSVTAVVSGSTLRLTHDSAGTVTVTSSSANVGTSFPVSNLQNTASFIRSTKTSTGTYKASFLVPTNVTSSTLYEKWWVSNETTGLIKGHSGDCPVNIRQFYTANTNVNNSGLGPQDRFITSVTNLKDSYSQKEKVKFRVFVRENNWQPNIYSVAQNTAEAFPIIKGFYKIVRESDGLEIVKFSTGSLGYSQLSYDNYGNYFDFDMSVLKEDYVYNISFLYDVNGSFVEQKEKFKFRVHK
mgnify:CR=1 FL=1